MHRIYEFDIYRLDTGERRLFREGAVIPLTPKVFDTLVLFLENPNRLLCKRELMDALWPDSFVEELTLAQNISQLRRALDEASRGPKLIQTVPKLGYRFVATVRQVEAGSGGSAIHISPSHQESKEPATAPAAFLPQAQDVQRPKRDAWPFLAAALLFVACMAYFLVRAMSEKANTTPIRSIAVLPIANLSSDPDQEFLADGMTDDLITALARFRSLRVISRTSVLQYKGTKKNIAQIAKELNVDALVEGSVSRRNGRVHLTVQFIRPAPEQHLWAESYDLPLDESDSVQPRIAQAIAGVSQATLTSDASTRIAPAHIVDKEAHRLYQKGRYFWNKRTPEGITESAKYFQQAIAKDEFYAEAYVGLADAYIFEGGWGLQPATEMLPKAQVAAQRALVIDPENAEAHAALGLIAMNYNWDWAKAEEEFKQALAISPNDPVTHHWYAECLAAQGRFPEGLSELRLAEESDPVSLAIASDRGKLLYFSRRYDEAIVQLQKVLAMDPSFVQALHWLIRARAQQGIESTAELKQLHQYIGDSVQYYATESLVMSATHQPEKLARSMTEARRRLNTDPDPAAAFFVELSGGDNAKALACLEQCYRTHSTIMTSLKVNPDYDPIRNEPEFAAYLPKVNLAK